MVRPKEEKSFSTILKEMADEYDRKNPIIATRFWVAEYTPGYNTGGYYDQDVAAIWNKVSDYYDTFEEADEWRSQHVADEGKKLLICKEHCRRIVHETWGLSFYQVEK